MEVMNQCLTPIQFLCQFCLKKEEKKLRKKNEKKMDQDSYDYCFYYPSSWKYVL